MGEYIRNLLVLCPLIFFGGFVDSIAGGGGIITLPAYLMLGFPAHLAAGTNKAVSSCGSTIASFKYIRNGNVRWSVAVYSIVGALAGGMLGSRLALLAPEGVLKAIMLIALPLVAIFLLVKRDFGLSETKKEHSNNMAAAIAFFIGLSAGAYDGLVGPGTGTFMMMLFTGLLGMDLLAAAGNSRISNMASNYGALAVFVINGHVKYSVLLPVAACSMLGNWMGARFAIKGGSKRVRHVMLFVLVLIFVKIGYDFFVAASA